MVIDPQYNFGAPSIDGFSTEVLAELAEAGEPIEDVAGDCGLAVDRLRQALAYEWSPAA